MKNKLQWLKMTESSDTLYGMLGVTEAFTIVHGERYILDFEFNRSFLVCAFDELQKAKDQAEKILNAWLKETGFREEE